MTEGGLAARLAARRRITCPHCRQELPAGVAQETHEDRCTTPAWRRRGSAKDLTGAAR